MESSYPATCLTIGFVIVVRTTSAATSVQGNGPLLAYFATVRPITLVVLVVRTASSAASVQGNGPLLAYFATARPITLVVLVVSTASRMGRIVQPDGLLDDLAAQIRPITLTFVLLFNDLERLRGIGPALAATVC